MTMHGIGRPDPSAPDMLPPAPPPVPAPPVVPPEPPAPRTVDRRYVAAGAAAFVVLIAGLVVAVSVSQSPAPPRYQASPQHSSPWRIVLPPTTDHYTQPADQAPVSVVLAQLRANGIPDPVGARYVSDLDPRNSVLVYGTHGRAPEPDTAFDTLRQKGYTLGTPVTVTLPAVAGRGQCVDGDGSGVHQSVCVFTADDVFLVFRFDGPGTAAAPDAAAQVPLLAFDIIKPA